MESGRYVADYFEDLPGRKWALAALNLLGDGLASLLVMAAGLD